MLHLFHASSSRLFSKRLAGQSKQAWLSHCWIYAGERQWLTEGVPASWRCQCQSTFSAPQMRGILRCANTPYRGVKERRESRSNTEHTLRACCDLVPTTKTKTKTKSCVSYIPVHTPTPPTSLRRAWRCLHLSRPCHRTGFIPSRGVWLARGEVHRILSCLPFFHAGIPPLSIVIFTPPGARGARFEI